MKNRKSFFYALAIFVGTIIGVGLFGIPYVGAQAGFGVMVFYLVLIGTVAIIINLFYGEIAVRTKALHRLPGYAGLYLGKNGKRLAFAVKTLAIYGALLAYLIIGGQFLAALFGGSVYVYTFIFFLVGAYLIWRDQKSIGPVELILLIIFILIIIFLFLSGVGHIKLGNLALINFNNFFIPYGVVLFSLWGTSVIPEVKEILKGDLKQVRRVVVYGIVICVVITLLFSLLIIGISGKGTTQESLSGLEGHLGQWVLAIGYIFGIITTFTSFIALGLTVKKIFWYDYHLPKHLAWFIACSIPIFLFIIGLQNFIEIIGLTGALMLGLDGMLVVTIYLRIKRKQDQVKYIKVKLLGLAVFILLSLGVILEVFYFFTGY